jgi:hypothetical protein
MLRAALCALLVSVPCAAAEPPVNLWCARGTPDYPDAAMTLKAHGSHIVDVIFVGFRPSRGRADWSLRDCLSTAMKLDGSRDIVARLWYRDRERRNPLEPLVPHGLVYKASSRTFVSAP